MKPTIVPRGTDAPTLDPIPDYLERVFDSPDLLQRATEIAGLLADVPEDAALELLAVLSRQNSGWTRHLLCASGFLLLHRLEYRAAEPWEARAA